MPTSKRSRTETYRNQNKRNLSANGRESNDVIADDIDNDQEREEQVRALDESGGASEQESDEAEKADACDEEDQSEINEALTKFKSTAGMYKTEVYSKTVLDVAAWLKADMRISSRLLVPQQYYQRNPGEGWTEKQKGLYVASIFAGKAKTPFVINDVRATARIMDGGHRIKAIQEFLENKIGMVIDASGTKVMFKDMQGQDQIHFREQNLQIMEYKDLPLSDQISEYLNLNSGLSFSVGEKLGAMKQINYCVQVANCFLKDDPDCVKRFLPILTPDTKVSRMNDLLVSTFLSYNLLFRNEPIPLSSASSASPGAMAMALKEEFCLTISELNMKDRTFKPGENIIVNAAGRVKARAHASLQLYTDVTASEKASAAKGQTPYRLMLLCMMAVVEIPDLDNSAFKNFIEKSKANLRILKSKAYVNSNDIVEFCQAYNAFADMDF